MKRNTSSLLKFRLLQQRLSLREYQTKGLLQSLWDFVAHNCPAGNIGRFTNHQIAVGLDWDRDADELIEALSDPECQWLDQHLEHRLIIHDWPEHCEDSVHMALARKGGFFADGSAPRLNRFSKLEAKRIEEIYTSKTTHAHGERTASARKHHSHSLTLALPSPSSPSHTIPINEARENASQPIVSSFSSAVRDQAELRTPRDGQRDFVESVMRLGDPPYYGAWWDSVYLACMRAGEPTLQIAWAALLETEKRGSDLGAAYVAGEIKKAGVRLPAKPKPPTGEAA